MSNENHYKGIVTRNLFIYLQNLFNISIMEILSYNTCNIICIIVTVSCKFTISFPSSGRHDEMENTHFMLIVTTQKNVQRKRLKGYI